VLTVSGTCEDAAALEAAESKELTELRLLPNAASVAVVVGGIAEVAGDVGEDAGESAACSCTTLPSLESSTSVRERGPPFDCPCLRCDLESPLSSVAWSWLLSERSIIQTTGLALRAVFSTTSFLSSKLPLASIWKEIAFCGFDVLDDDCFSVRLLPLDLVAGACGNGSRQGAQSIIPRLCFSARSFLS